MIIGTIKFLQVEGRARKICKN